jgi:hypothetical protein
LAFADIWQLLFAASWTDFDLPGFGLWELHFLHVTRERRYWKRCIDSIAQPQRLAWLSERVALAPKAKDADQWQLALDCWLWLEFSKVGKHPKMRNLGIVVLCAALCGCASSTGILPAGPDTYTISERYSPIRGGSDEAERSVLTKANEFCAQQGRQFVPNDMGQTAGMANRNTTTGYTVTFKCLLPNDPAIKGYQLQAAPNVIIEQRNR